MSEWIAPFLGVLWSQTLWLSGCVVALALVRPLLLRAAGATATYALWLSVPLVLLAALVPARSPGLPDTVLRLRASALEAWQTPVGHWDALQQMAEHTVTGGVEYFGLLGALWLIGLLCSVAWMIAQHRHMMSRLHIDVAHDVWRSEAGTSPALVGWLSPRLSLPVDFETRFTEAEQTLIWAHEFVHQHRHDNLTNLFASLLCCIHWFNPLPWFALRRLRQDQELACDDSVLRGRDKVAVAHYARALLKAQDLKPLITRSPTLACTWQFQHPLLERVSMLNQHRLLSAWPRRVALMLSLSLSLCGAGVVHAVSGQEPPIQKGYHLVEIDADVKVDGNMLRAVRVTSNPSNYHWFSATDKRASTGNGDWLIQLKPIPSADAQFKLELVVLRPDPGAKVPDVEGIRIKARVVAKPILLVKEGQKARVEISDDKTHEVFSLDMTTRWVLAESAMVLKPIVDRQ